MSYLYNESGIRTQKTVDGTTTDYFLSACAYSKQMAQNNGQFLYQFRVLELFVGKSYDIIQAIEMTDGEFSTFVYKK